MWLPPITVSFTAYFASLREKSFEFSLTHCNLSAFYVT